MGNSATSGLTKRGGIWHIDKQYRGSRICESTGTSSLAKAQEYLAKRMNDIREAHLHGVRSSRTFLVAATKYLEDYAHKKSIGDDALHLKMLVPMIGTLDLQQVHMGALQDFIAKRISTAFAQAARSWLPQRSIWKTTRTRRASATMHFT